ncbi:amino acid adenylation domain-containing protein [Kordia sp. YSTF-M3]|uniref:Amino acid adenylation domain-containing protein n=1 Tax=Kordia aestuariivivens TaxID=2759037 RepID=A0ABR7QGF3_9FLAO|nr:non-ribosomal peptide synthetase [Kordia aestuariivivens]MBC8757651.1 amino acid adenylation domain-containing protein [Kordia aestuariivivens]
MNSKELINALKKGEISIESYKKLLENKSNETAVVKEIPNQLDVLNAKLKPVSAEKCIHEVFEEIAEKYPHKIAVSHNDESISYANLNKKSNALAQSIQKRGILPDAIIGIYMNRSIESIIAVLGILKAGAAFLPLDVNYPTARISYIIQNSKLKIVLTKKEVHEKLQTVKQGANIEEIILEEVAEPEVYNLQKNATSTNLAYIIYTSGTTGFPKGVMVQHNGFVTMITDQIQSFSCTANDTFAQFASISFDASIYELFLALLSGGTLVIIPEDIKKNGKLLRDYFIQKEITIATLPPTLVATIPKEKKLPLKTLITAGEAANIEDVKHYSKYLTYINAYGPTETSVCASSYTVNPNTDIEEIPIGTPLSNIQFHILDVNLKQVAVGIPGELYLSGIGVARGYLNNPELTQERFSIINGKRSYKTGDRVICKPDGNVYFLGRTDHQIKIRGFRVDPEEIEVVLQEQEDVQNATIIAKKVNGNLSLLAYYTAAEKIKSQVLKSFLQDRVPSYMLPHFFIFIEKMPLTLNGKIDREQLRNKELALDLDNQYVAAQNETEKELVAIWEDILGIDAVGVEDNFFDLGGDSIKNIQVINKASKYGLDLKNKDLFKHQTIQELSKNVALFKNNETETSDVKPAETLSQAEIDAFIEENNLVDQKENIEAVFSLTSLQLGILYEHLKASNTGLYYLQSLVTIEEKINYEIFEETISEVIARYDALRTGVFYQNIANPLQVTFKKCEPTIEILDWRTIEHKEEKLKQTIASRRRHSFNLNNPPLFRICFIEYDDTTVKLLVESHHILMDGWSNGILLKYIFNSYSKKKYQTPFNPVAPTLYRNYVAQLKHTQNKTQEKIFWEEHLKGFDEITPLPLENLDNKLQLKNAVMHKETKFYNDLTNAAKFTSFSQSNRITPNTITLTAFFILLKKLTNKDDILIGGISSGRSLRGIDTKDSVGLHVNTTPFRVSMQDSQLIDDFLKNIQETSLQRLEYEHTSIADIYSYCDYKSPEGLFQILYGFQNFPKYQVKNQETKIKISKLETIEQDHYPLGFAFSFSDNLEVTVNYDTNRYSEKTIDTFIYYFKNIIASILQKVENETVATLPILKEKDIQQVVYDWNANASPIPTMCMHEAVEKYAKQNPNAIAVQDAFKSISYSELNTKSNQLATYLQAQNIKKGDSVAVYLERSVDVIIAITGIMKAGAVYVPIAIATPEKRIAYILENANAKTLITQENLQEKTQAFQKDLQHIITFDSDRINEYENNNLEAVLPTDIAYIIYTSGSTGVPKGVPIAHRSFVNMIVDKIKRFDVQQKDVLSQITSLSFDASLSEIFLALFAGSKLVIIPENVKKSGTEIIAYLKTHQITVSTLTPAYISVLDKKEKLPLRTLISGGEKAKTEDVAHYTKYLNYINAYGPTEASICVSCYKVKSENIGQNIPIGKPLANTKLYVLDKHENPQPIGVPGELYIGGVGLTNGYLNKNELTKKAFIKSPFANAETIYKTGDLVKWLPDGNLLFLERADFQVKIRGHRIELGEIENTLQKHADVKENVVIHKTSNTESFLICFYCAENNAELDSLKLKSFLKTHLPDYMIPAKFIKLEVLPLTTNGKIDLKKLKSYQVTFASSKEIVAPTNETERKLAEIWKNELKIAQLSIHDNFYELGGDSIKIMKILGQIQHEFGQKIEINVFSDNATVAMLASVLSAHKNSDSQQIQPAPVAEYYPMSNTQLRFWMQYQMGLKIVANSISVFNLNEEIDKETFELAINLCIQKHEILRTAFIEIEKTPKQKILPATAFEFFLSSQDITRSEDWKKEVIQLANKVSSEPFDLSNPPLIKGQLLKVKQEKYVFLLTLHHSIVDGWSIKLLFEEITENYKKLREQTTYKPTPLRIHYKDYSVWLQSQLAGDLGAKALGFWKNQYSNGVKDFHFPTDYERKKEKTTEGKRIALEIHQDKFSKLKEIAETENASLYMVLLSLINVSLARHTNSNEITVRTPVHGRFHLDLQNQIGPYINSIPVRTEIRGAETFQGLIKANKEFMLQVFNYQFYPIDKLASDLNVKRYYDRMPFSDVVVVMQNKDMIDTNLQEDDVSAADLSDSGIISMVDLRIELNELEDSLQIALDYNSDLFKPSTIQELADTIILLTDEIIKNPTIQIDALKKDTSNQEIKKSFDFDFFFDN